MMKKNLLFTVILITMISIATVSCKKENCLVRTANNTLNNALTDTPYRHTNTIQDTPYLHNNVLVQDTPYIQVTASDVDTPYLHQ